MRIIDRRYFEKVFLQIPRCTYLKVIELEISLWVLAKKSQIEISLCNLENRSHHTNE